jgi:hypothetical protein
MDTQAPPEQSQPQPQNKSPPRLKNKGTGAGGANTNLNGKTFEEKTSNESRLLATGFERKQIPGRTGPNDYYFEKVLDAALEQSIVYCKQGALKAYFAHFFATKLERCPDEAYILRTGESYTLKILEKKNQNVAGSVEEKLLTGDAIRFEYQCCLGERFKVAYAFCLSTFLKDRYCSDALKWRSLRLYNTERNIQVLFGDDEDYFTKLDAWIHL